ncbi:MAG: hypothetical protein LAO78_28660 [Acidobacteriia bacterium]|nr:hypothetical protein [Terriglobia bacterium]
MGNPKLVPATSSAKKPPASEGVVSKTAKSPAIPISGLAPSPYLASVVELFIEYIADSDRTKVVIPQLAGEVPFPVAGTPADQHAFLERYVRYQLDSIAAFEYKRWMNGRMPFVTPRDLQIWRLYMFCRHIWQGRLPRHDHLGILFNLTPRRAAGLLGDFYARFRKRFLFPIFIQQMFEDLEKVNKFTKQTQTVGGRAGKWVPLRDTWHKAEMDALLVDPIVRKHLPGVHHRVITLPDHPGEIFVTQEIIDALLPIRGELEAAYPVTADDSDE